MSRQNEYQCRPTEHTVMATLVSEMTKRDKMILPSQVLVSDLRNRRTQRLDGSGKRPNPHMLCVCVCVCVCVKVLFAVQSTKYAHTIKLPSLRLPMMSLMLEKIPGSPCLHNCHVRVSKRGSHGYWSRPLTSPSHEEKWSGEPS